MRPSRFTEEQIIGMLKGTHAPEAVLLRSISSSSFSHS